MKRQFAQRLESGEVFEVYVLRLMSKSKLQILQRVFEFRQASYTSTASHTHKGCLLDVWTHGAVSAQQL